MDDPCQSRESTFQEAFSNYFFSNTFRNFLLRQLQTERHIVLRVPRGDRRIPRVDRRVLRIDR